MSHVCIFPTWKCQLSCEYCSIRNSKIDRMVEQVHWSEWAVKLPKVLPHGSIIDIAGGEPLLYPGIVDLLYELGISGLRWALTSNLKEGSVVDSLCATRPAGGVCINMSDHIGNPEATINKLKLRDAGYAVNVHRVDHPSAGHHEEDAQLITYQDWPAQRAVDGIKRRCNAGIHHWIAGPNGDMWRCIVAEQTGQPTIGNLFTDYESVQTVNIKQSGGLECNFGCTTCYTEDPASWEVSWDIF